MDDVNTMKCVSVGEAGVWGVKAKDESVWVRSYSQDGKAAGKVPVDKDAGADWMKLQVGQSEKIAEAKLRKNEPL